MTPRDIPRLLSQGFSNAAVITLQWQLDMGTLPRPVVRGEKVRAR